MKTRGTLLLPLFILAFAARGGTAVEKMRDMLGHSSDFLKAGRYAEALKLDETVLREMGEYYVSGTATTQFFTIAVVHKALALAGLGRNDDALWEWHTAISLYPAVERSDMSEYGAAGVFLTQHPPAPPDPISNGARVTPASVKKRVEPKFPSQSVNARVEGPIQIEVIIGRDGKPRAPRVIDTIGAPILGYATAEALREWRFEPATVDGTAVEQPMRITMQYRVR